MADATANTEPPRKREIKRLSPLQWLGLFLAAALVRLWAATLRFEVDAESLRLLTRPGPKAFVLWHNRLFLVGSIYRRYVKCRGQRLYSLVSASGDGAWLAAFLKLMGMDSVRGSTSWRGTAALRGLRSQLDAGNAIGITPDGPRGPCYHFHPGVVTATEGGRRAPALLLNATFGKAWRLGSWDGFYLPRPFSRIRLHLAEAPQRQPGESAKAQARRWCDLLKSKTVDLPAKTDIH